MSVRPSIRLFVKVRLLVLHLGGLSTKMQVKYNLWLKLKCKYVLERICGPDPVRFVQHDSHFGMGHCFCKEYFSVCTQGYRCIMLTMLLFKVCASSCGNESVSGEMLNFFMQVCRRSYRVSEEKPSAFLPTPA